MNVLYLEPVGGIAGDMFLACCIDLGVDPAQLKKGLELLGLPGWSLVVNRAERHSIVGTHVEVRCEKPDTEERTWPQIQALIQGSALSAEVKQRSLRTFEVLALAEARVHGVDVRQVHFHEVGAVDSIIDLVGASICLELLGFPEVRSAPPALGSGMVRTRHGMVPVPGPATLELLKDRPVRFEGVGELTTPSGAAILVALTNSGISSELTPQKIGMGMGTRELADRPNMLRGTLGTMPDAPESDLSVLEANIDDMNPQLFGPLMEGVLARGALDVWVVPVVMKKGRPGHLLCILCTHAQIEAIRAFVFCESTTLGIRRYSVDRVALERRLVPATTPWGVVQIKVGLLQGRPVTATPEFEDCRRLGLEHGRPIKEVMAAAIAHYQASGSRP